MQKLIYLTHTLYPTSPMKPPIVILLSLAFALQAYSQVSLPYSSDFENEEGFVSGTFLPSDWTATKTLLVVANDAAQFGSQSIRITRAKPIFYNRLHRRTDATAVEASTAVVRCDDLSATTNRTPIPVLAM